MSFWTGTGIALLVALVLYGPSAKAQIQPEEFRSRTANHIERVTVLAEVLRDEFPEHFGSLTPELVYQYLSEYHDAPKLLALHQLRNYGYTGSLGIDQILARFYGTNRLINQLSGSEQTLLNYTIGELNRIENLLKENFFLRWSVTDEEIQALKLLEKIVDLTDTGIARWSEMGVPKEQALASTFVSQMEGYELMLPLILWLENRYDQILHQPKVVACQFLLQSVGP